MLSQDRTTVMKAVLKYPHSAIPTQSSQISPMSSPPPLPPARSVQILKTVLYILSGLALLLGLVIGLSLMFGADNMVANVLLPLQLIGVRELSNLVARLLSGFLINLGILTIIISIILSALLYATGRLVGHTALLEARLARLEAKA